ncbi:hypothetical protein CCMA1212_001996 [Trichoderma ghanense]|uniref:Uncharacterized protein n=1 Tax=Trichoderma ghanense TaxID=65468 RepID=A0ABY2HDC2_9HYPO
MSSNLEGLRAGCPESVLFSNRRRSDGISLASRNEDGGERRKHLRCRIAKSTIQVPLSVPKQSSSRRSTLFEP